VAHGVVVQILQIKSNSYTLRSRVAATSLPTCSMLEIIRKGVCVPRHGGHWRTHGGLGWL